MRCLFKAIFLLKAVYLVACDFLDLLGLRAGTHGEISFDSVNSRSSSVYVNVNYSHEHTVNS